MDSEATFEVLKAAIRAARNDPAGRYELPVSFDIEECGPVIYELVILDQADLTDTWSTVCAMATAVEQVKYELGLPTCYEPKGHVLNDSEDWQAFELLDSRIGGSCTDDDLVQAGEVLERLIAWVRKQGWEI